MRDLVSIVFTRFLPIFAGVGFGVAWFVIEPWAEPFLVAPIVMLILSLDDKLDALYELCNLEHRWEERSDKSHDGGASEQDRRR